MREPRSITARNGSSDRLCVIIVYGEEDDANNRIFAPNDRERACPSIHGITPSSGIHSLTRTHMPTRVVVQHGNRTTGDLR